MNRNLMPFDVLQNSFVRGWLPADIVFRRQTIDGDCCCHSLEFCPFDGNRPNGAGDDLDVNIPGFEDGQYLIQLSETHQWFSTDNGHMQRPVLIHQTNHSIDQSLSLKIADLPKYGISPKMIRPVCITARASERAFLCNFNRQNRWTAGKNGFPPVEDFSEMHSQN